MVSKISLILINIIYSAMCLGPILEIENIKLNWSGRPSKYVVVFNSWIWFKLYHCSDDIVLGGNTIIILFWLQHFCALVHDVCKETQNGDALLTGKHFNIDPHLGISSQSAKSRWSWLQIMALSQLYYTFFKTGRCLADIGLFNQFHLLTKSLNYIVKKGLFLFMSLLQEYKYCKTWWTTTITGTGICDLFMVPLVHESCRSTMYCIPMCPPIKIAVATAKCSNQLSAIATALSGATSPASNSSRIISLCKSTDSNGDSNSKQQASTAKEYQCNNQLAVMATSSTSSSGSFGSKQNVCDFKNMNIEEKRNSQPLVMQTATKE